MGCAVLSRGTYLHLQRHREQAIAPIGVMAIGDPMSSLSRTSGGAVGRTFAMRDAALRAFAQALAAFVMHGGVLTDELRYQLNGLRDMPRMPDGSVRKRDPLNISDARQPWYRVNHRDARILPERRTADTLYHTDELGKDYLLIQGSRALLRQAMQQLDWYARFPFYGIGQPVATDTAAIDRSVLGVWRGELYALDGYTDIMLADLFCSGVPNNTFRTSLDVGNVLDPLWDLASVYTNAIAHGGVVFHPSLTTAQVYTRAIAKFDTALTLAHDSTRILNLARVGKARAWLALGQYDSAAAAVAAVPRGYAYLMRTQIELDDDGEENIATVADREGINGLPFVSSDDPRTATAWVFSDKVLNTNRMPAKYWQGGHLKVLVYEDSEANARSTAVAVPFPLASWEEVVLIRAEAALHKTTYSKRNLSVDLTWLRLLNELRATAPIPGTMQPAPVQLPPLIDPGTDRGRIALLFAERAYWLFLTGHRQGDLRRLVREYHWPQDQVYPTGPYIVPRGVIGAPERYGTDVNMPIAPEEFANPNFHGCLNRAA